MSFIGTQKLLFKRSSISRFLAAKSFDPSSNLYSFTETQYIGFCFEISPMNQMGEDARVTLENLLNKDTIPDNSMFSFALWSSPNISKIKSQHSLVRSERFVSTGSDESDALLKRLSGEALEHLSSGTKKPVEHISKTRINNKRGFVSFVTKIKKTKKPEIDSSKIYSALMSEIMAVLDSVGFSPRILKPRSLLEVYHEMLNWAPNATWLEGFEYDDHIPINEQVQDATTEFVKMRQPGVYRINDRFVMAATMSKAPDYPSIADTAKFIQKLETATGTGVKDNSMFCSHIYYGDRVSDKKEIARNEKTYRFLTAGSKESKASSTYGAHRDMHEGVERSNRAISICSSVVIFGDSETDVIEKAQQAIAHLGTLQYKYLDEKIIGHGIFYAMLPMNFLPDKGVINLISRFKRCLPEHASRMLPVVSEWTGIGRPTTLFAGRSGQILPLTLYDTGSNYNWLGMAMSGSGKSVLANRFVSDYLSCGAKFFIIDQGHSYITTCEIFNGTYITFDGDNCPNLNPFPHIVDWDGQDAEGPMVVGVVSEMMSINPKRDKLEISIIEDVINTVWLSKGNQAGIDDIYNTLLEQGESLDDRRYSDLAMRLKKWTTHGIYGRYYTEGVPVDFDRSRLVVLDIDALKDKEDLSRVVVMQLILQINRYIYAKVQKGDNSWANLLIDEAWKFMAEGDAGEHNAVLQFILTAYRQFRKHNASIGLLVQSLEDVYSNPAGKAIADNAAVKIFLGQDPASVEQLAEKKRIDLSPYWINQLKTVSTFKVRGGFSELFIMTKDRMGVGRLILSPFTLKVFGTEADDRTKIKDLRKSGVGLIEAIEMVADA